MRKSTPISLSSIVKEIRAHHRETGERISQRQWGFKFRHGHESADRFGRWADILAHALDGRPAPVLPNPTKKELARKPKKVAVAKRPPVEAEADAPVLPALPDDDIRLIRLREQLTAQQEENAGLRRQLKASFKEGALFRALADELNGKVIAVDPLPSSKAWLRPASKKSTRIVCEDLVMHISDMHSDEIVKPHQVGGLESYSFPIACGRAETYVDTVLEYCLETLHNYRFNRLWILSNGDNVSGEIHESQKHSSFSNALQSSLAAGQLLALMIRDLAPHFEDVQVLSLPGNHGRRSVRTDYHGAHDNWDFLVAETARLTCRDLDNVHFTTPDAHAADVEIRGHGFHVEHGSDLKFFSANFSIPYYAMERKTRRLMALDATKGLKTKYFVMGHFHNFSTLQALGGEVLVNGAWVATSPYAYQALSTFSEPFQLLHGVHDNGISWRLNVRLRKNGTEYTGKRYWPSLSKAVGGWNK